MPLRRTPLAKRSQRTRRLYDRPDGRRAYVDSWLAEHPWCARCGLPADDVHELKSRARGGSILDEANTVSLCRPCHTWVTDHPADATAEGWTRHSWD